MAYVFNISVQTYEVIESRIRMIAYMIRSFECFSFENIFDGRVFGMYVVRAQMQRGYRSTV